MTPKAFCLGFHRSELCEKTAQFEKQKETLIRLWKCLYGETDEGRELRRAIVGTFVGQWGAQSLNWLPQIAAQFKNRAFCEEREWRLFLQTSAAQGKSDLVEFHDGRFGRTPHIAIPIGLKDQGSPLRRIVVGPSQNKNQAVTSLRLELARMGIAGVEVIPSKIPYRNW